MKKSFLSILFLILVNIITAQVVVELSNISGAEPGALISVPVKVTGLDGANGGIPVSAIELHIAFDSNSAEYDTTLDFNTAMPLAQWFFGSIDNEYSTNWIEPNLQTLNIQDHSVLFNIVFLYKGGNTTIEFISNRCELLNANYEVITGVTYMSATITPGAGSDASRWNGNGDWNTAANWSNGIPGDNTNAIVESGMLLIQSSSVSKSLTVSNGSTLQIYPDGSLTVDSTFDNNGTFQILSDASGTGSAIFKGDITGTGSFSTQNYLAFDGTQYHLLGCPVENNSVAAVSSFQVASYSESSASWTQLSGSSILERGKAYKVSGDASDVSVFSGKPLSSDLTINNLQYSNSNVTEKGLNLIGNPFTSALVYGQDWTGINTDQSIYCWNGYNYVSWNGSIGSLTDGIIPAMQGFFVRANSANASVTIPSSARIHSNQPYLKSSAEVSNTINLKIESTLDPLHFDEAFIQVDPLSTVQYDGQFDAYKLPGLAEFPQIYSVASGDEKMSINVQPQKESVSVVCEIPQAGSYRITFGNLSSFPQDQQLSFEDKKENTSINLRTTSSYTFLSDGSSEPSRFMLHYYLVGMDELLAEKLQFRIEGDKLLIDGPEQGNSEIQSLDLYSITGQKIIGYRNLGIPSNVNLPSVSPGLYILRVSTAGVTFSRKIFLN
ncbi:MAG: T9SS type A sorting domain-containing protein [Bacteroidales bacterium]|nr:T9SS type A sorting domain-containing protein [Bacteroidales bacterium]